MTVLATLVVGPVMDRFGRKRVMVASLLVSSLCFFLLTRAETLPAFAAISVLRGLFAPLFRVGADTMVTDLVAEEDRYSAFSLTRTSSNIGFAFGPAVGGFIAASSFTTSLWIGSSVLGIAFLLSTFLLKETLPRKEALLEAEEKPSMGYGQILRDKRFLVFLSGDMLVKMGMVMMFSLLSVYVKENFNILENRYGFIMTVNAFMAATLQVPATTLMRRFPAARVLPIGAVFYALGLGSVALGSRFEHFVISMVVMTIGELIFMPTAMATVAGLSPSDMRGRYMSVYSMTMGAAKGIGPFIGGILNDQIAPSAIWLGAMVMCSMSAIVFVLVRHLLLPAKEPLQKVNVLQE